MNHPLSSVFDLREKDRPLCFGSYVDSSTCHYCEWRKECEEGEPKKQGGA